MKNIFKKIVTLALIALLAQMSLFSEENTKQETEVLVEKKSIFELGKDVAELKCELYKIENKIGEYEDTSDFDLSFIKAKKERMLRKRNEEFLKALNNDNFKAEEILDKAAKDIMSKAKELKDKGKDFLDYVLKYFE